MVLEDNSKLFNITKKARKIKLKGIRAHGRLYLSGMGPGIKKIPPYFTIEVDLDTIKPRQKEKCKQ